MATDRNPFSGTDLMVVLRETKDAAALDGLLIQYLPLAHRIAERFRESGCCLTEVTEAATFGLNQALLEYDSGSGQELVTLAVPAIVGAIKERMREQNREGMWLQKLQSQKAAVERAAVSLTADLGRPPMVAELAGFTGLSQDQVYETFELPEVVEPVAAKGSGVPDVSGIDFSLPNGQAQDERYLTPSMGRSKRGAMGQDRQSRSKAELLI